MRIRKYFPLFLIGAVVQACDKDDQMNTELNGLLGSWKLIEVYADTGGGGSFEAVESNKTITFQSNGMLTSNGDLCSMSVDSNSPTSGTYSTIDSTINVNCNLGYDYQFRVDNNELIINYPCIEPCQAKYEKL